MSKELKNLIHQCLDLDPSKRIKAEKIIEHDWFTLKLGKKLSSIQTSNK